jgi:hypothetical protein
MASVLLATLSNLINPTRDAPAKCKHADTVKKIMDIKAKFPDNCMA